MVEHPTAERATRRTEPRAEARVETRTDERLFRPSNMGMDNPFELDHSLIPAGMVMEFKRLSVLGMNDRRHQNICHRFHWTPVLNHEQPHILGMTETDPNAPIVVGGLQLMKRPAYLTEEAHQERKDTAQYQINQQLSSVRAASKAQVGEANTKISRTYERVAGPQPVE
jgi:hypothetical protein